MNAFLNRSAQLQYNKSLFNDYYKYVSPLKLSEKTKSRYFEAIIIFLEKINMDISEITDTDIQNYLDKLTSHSQKNFTIGRLKNFTRFAQTNNKKIKYDISKFKTIKKANKMETHHAKVLSLDSIRKIRCILWKNKHYKHLLIFELAYIYGLTLKQLLECNIENFDRESCSILLNNNRQIQIPQRLIPIVLANTDTILDKKAGINAYQRYFSEISEITKIKFSWQDIEETRKIFGIKCSICGNKFPNEINYWAGIKYYDDPNGLIYIVCRSCAKKIGNENAE